MKKKLIEIPEELFQKIVKDSIKENRSVNKQIIFVLKNKYK